MQRKLQPQDILIISISIKSLHILHFFAHLTTNHLIHALCTKKTPDVKKGPCEVGLQICVAKGHTGMCSAILRPGRG